MLNTPDNQVLQLQDTLALPARIWFRCVYFYDIWGICVFGCGWGCACAHIHRMIWILTWSGRMKESIQFLRFTVCTHYLVSVYSTSLSWNYKFIRYKYTVYTRATMSNTNSVRLKMHTMSFGQCCTFWKPTLLIEHRFHIVQSLVKLYFCLANTEINVFADHIQNRNIHVLTSLINKCYINTLIYQLFKKKILMAMGQYFVFEINMKVHLHKSFQLDPWHFWWALMNLRNYPPASNHRLKAKIVWEIF